MVLSRGNKIPSIGVIGSGKGQKGLYRQPEPNINMTPTGINLSSPVLQAQDQELDPAQKRLLDLTSSAEEAKLKRSGGGFRELESDRQDRLAGMINTIYALKKAKTEFKKKGYSTGFLAGRVPLEVKGYLNPKEVGYWNTNVRDVLSKYLKDQTGAARGFQEMQWYSPVFPERIDPSSVVVDKFDRNIRGIQKNVDTLIGVLEDNGYNPTAMKRMKIRAYGNFLQGGEK